MPRPPDDRRRKELLDGLITAFATGGIGGRSLREVAEAVGTSHRMLLHHFGSREELILAIVDEVERRQTLTLATLPTNAADAVAAMWADVRRRELWPFERLFFECYARGAQGEEPFDRLLPALVDDWLVVFPKGRARARARLAVAVLRGLLLDLVATEDRRGVDRAMQEFLALLAD